MIGVVSGAVGSTLSVGDGNIILRTGIGQLQNVKTSTVRIEYMVVNLDNMTVEKSWMIHKTCSSDPCIYLPEAYKLRLEKHQSYSPINQKHIRIRVISEQTERIMDIIQ